MDSRPGSNPGYWLVKVQADYSGNAEEFWLVTRAERKEFTRRAERNSETLFHKRRGVFTTLRNTKHPKSPKDSQGYWAVRVRGPQGLERWFLTDRNMERLRVRASHRSAAIDANKTGWLANFFD